MRLLDKLENVSQHQNTRWSVADYVFVGAMIALLLTWLWCYVTSINVCMDVLYHIAPEIVR